MKKFEVGNIYWGIRTGWGFERICQVKLISEIKKNGEVIGYDSKDAGDGALVGTSGIKLEHLFHTENEAKAYRKHMASVQIEAIWKSTNTPEKMLAYLLDNIQTETDGYIDDQVNKDIRKRAQELFGIKL